MHGFFEHQYLSYKKSHIKNLLALAKADGHVHAKEQKMLLKIGKRLLRRVRLRHRRSDGGLAALSRLRIIRRLRAAIVILVRDVPRALLGDGIDTDLRAGSEAKEGRYDDDELFHRLASKLPPLVIVVNSIRDGGDASFPDHDPSPHLY